MDSVNLTPGPLRRIDLRGTTLSAAGLRGALPRGGVDVDAVVQERDADSTARLDVGNGYMLAELATVLDEEAEGARGDAAFPFRLIPRRHPNFMNSSGTALAALNRGKPYNPVYMHPDSAAELGLRPGSSVMVTSRHDCVPAVLEADDSVRLDVVAMHHALRTPRAPAGGLRAAA